MAKRALLIGCETGGLTGVSNDVDAMAQWLDGLGFSLDVRQGPSATRQGVFEGLRRLTRDSRCGDSVAIYYSGHGGHSQVASERRVVGDRLAPRAVQYLVPTDHDKLECFRGIFRAELSLAVQRLSERTSNITVILDCCHSTDMIRDDDAVLKAVVEPWGDGVESHLEWLRAQGHELDRLPGLRNASMVLLSACEATRKAFEITRQDDGVRCGLFTDCLLRVAEGSRGARSTWDDVMRRVVQRALSHRSSQRPQVSGPSSRYPFEERRRDTVGALTLEGGPGAWFLSGGEVAGVRPGDRFRVLDPLADEAEPVDFEVSAVDARRAGLRPCAAGTGRLEAGMLALHVGGPTHEVCRVEGVGSLADELRRRVVEVPGLGVAAPSGDDEPAFVLEVIGNEVRARDADGRRLRWPRRVVGESRIGALLDELRLLARGSELLGLAREWDVALRPRTRAHRLDWGLVRGGRARSLPLEGAELQVGDRIFVSIENTSSWAVWVSIFDIGVGRRVALLNPNEPEGIDLGSGEIEILGAREYGRLTGLELSWPEDTPPDGPLDEALVVVLSSGPLPLTSWRSSPASGWPEVRDVTAGSMSAVVPTYEVRTVTFRLRPSRSDEDPEVDGSKRSRTGGSDTSRPR